MEDIRIIDEKYIRENLRKRSREGHKGTYGRDLIFAGSPGMAGAAALCAKSALRSGAGTVSCLIESFNSPMLNILQCAVPEATCVEAALDMDLEKYNAIGCGPGLGNKPGAVEVLHYISGNYSGDLVLDADALNIISSDSSLAEAVKNSNAAKIMTPHIGEARRLLKTAAKLDSESERLSAARDISAKYNSIVVLKSFETLIVSSADPDIIYKNITGNPGMATGGSGDVLTGVITALCGQGHSPLHSAAMGVYIHAAAGDLAAGRLGEIGMISSDISSFLPEAFKKFC